MFEQIIQSIFSPEILTLILSGATYGIMNGIKKIGAIKFSENRKTILRRVVLPLLSIASLVATAVATGGEVDVASVEGAVQALTTGILATGWYQLFPSKKLPANLEEGGLG